MPVRAKQKMVKSSLALPVTERRNPRSMNLDELSIEQGIDLMLSEEAKVTRALAKERACIAGAIRLISARLKRGGRLLYVGAGTSGRLGVLDASECPPTFRTSPDVVQGIIAGGDTALRYSVEGAEDDGESGKAAIQRTRAGGMDVVVGIAASGTTPYVWGALEEAARRGCKTVLLCFNPAVTVPRNLRLSFLIAPNLGPEVLTGSTRLKAGTATKLVLNMFTTLTMVKLGKVISNLMVDVRPSNQKLRSRAIRIVCELTGVDEKVAAGSLEQQDWVIKRAVAELGRKSRSPGSRTGPLNTRRRGTARSPSRLGG